MQNILSYICIFTSCLDKSTVLKKDPQPQLASESASHHLQHNLEMAENVFSSFEKEEYFSHENVEMNEKDEKMCGKFPHGQFTKEKTLILEGQGETVYKVLPEPMKGPGSEVYFGIKLGGDVEECVAIKHIMLIEKGGQPIGQQKREEYENEKKILKMLKDSKRQIKLLGIEEKEDRLTFVTEFGEETLADFWKARFEVKRKRTDQTEKEPEKDSDRIEGDQEKRRGQEDLKDSEDQIEEVSEVQTNQEHLAKGTDSNEGFLMEKRMDRNEEDLKIARKIIRQVSEAMEELHEYGIIHLDFAMKNMVFVRDHKNVRTLKLIDFGNSKILDVKNVKKCRKNHKEKEREFKECRANIPAETYRNTGTWFIMTREQFKCRVTQKVDIWAFGVEAYFLLHTAEHADALPFPFTFIINESGDEHHMKYKMVELFDKNYDKPAHLGPFEPKNLNLNANMYHVFMYITAVIKECLYSDPYGRPTASEIVSFMKMAYPTKKDYPPTGQRERHKMPKSEVKKLKKNHCKDN